MARGYPRKVSALLFYYLYISVILKTIKILTLFIGSFSDLNIEMSSSPIHHASVIEWSA